MKKVILRAPVLTQSGYGVHARQIARWLLSHKDIDLHINAMPWGDTPWYIDSAAQSGLVGAIMERTRTPESFKGRCDSVSFQLQLPHEWDANIADINVGMTAGVETDRCHRDWISACNKMSAVVVPSQHAAECLRASGTINVPLYVIPEAWSSDCLLPTTELPTLPDFETDTNVLLFGQLTGSNPHNDRKNTFFAIKWLCELFSDNPRVGIVLKTNACRNTLIDRDIVVNALRGMLAQVRHSGKGPKVHLMHGDMSDAEVVSLYRHHQVCCLASLTRGEGFGLPLLEAAANGLPVIATAWSGHTDFLGNMYAPVQYQLEPVHNSRIDGQIFVPGARWATPNEQDFKRRVKELVTNQKSARELATKLQHTVLETHSHTTIDAVYETTFGKYFVC